MRTMYDGTAALARGIHDRFPQAEMIAGYVDGDNPWPADDWALWTGPTVKVEISRVAANGIGDVLDVEPGLAAPEQAGAWIALRKRAGYNRPTIYCSRSVIPAVRQGTGSYILGRDYDIWVADWTGQPHQVAAPGLPAAECAATQYASTTSYDLTAVYDDAWPHRDHQEPPPPFGFTPWQYLNVSWPAGRDLIIQVRDHAGEVLTEHTGILGHWQTAAFAPGTCEVRAQYPDGTWSEWRQS